jgi:signal peptidase I
MPPAARVQYRRVKGAELRPGDIIYFRGDHLEVVGKPYHLYVQQDGLAQINPEESYPLVTNPEILSELKQGPDSSARIGFGRRLWRAFKVW